MGFPHTPFLTVAEACYYTEKAVRLRRTAFSYPNYSLASPAWHSRHFKPEYRFCCRSLAAMEQMAASSPTMTSSSLARVRAVYSTPRTIRLGAEGMAASTTQRYSLPWALWIVWA